MKQLIFYGFCGSSLEDAVAIDNIVVDSTDSSTTEGPGLGKFIKHSCNW